MEDKGDCIKKMGKKIKISNYDKRKDYPCTRKNRLNTINTSNVVTNGPS